MKKPALKKLTLKKPVLKKPVLAVLIAAAVLCAALIVSVVLRQNGADSTFSGGEDTAYPYTWTMKADGSLTVTFSNGGKDGYVWSAENADVDILTASEPDSRGASVLSKESSTTFTLTPVGQGITMVSFVLAPGDDPSSPIFVFNITASVSKELVLSFVDSAWKELGSSGQEKLDTDCSCTWKNETDGSLLLQFSSRSGASYDWNAAMKNGIHCSLSDVSYSDGTSSMTVSGGSKGTETLVITGVSSAGGLPKAEFTLELNIDSSGAVQVISSKGAELAIAALTDAEKQNKAAAEKLVGRKLVLPENAVQQSWQVSGKYENTVTVTYYVGDREWIYGLSKSLTEAEMSAEYQKDASPQAVAQDGKNLTLYIAADSSRAVWTDQGWLCVLQTSALPAADLQAAAAEILKLNS